MAKAIFEVDTLKFEAKALQWAQRFEQVCYLQSNGYTDEYTSIESLLAVDALVTFESGKQHTFEYIEQFRAKYPNQWMLGFFGYDLKNEIEDLSTAHTDRLEFPDAYFFVPKTTLRFSATQVEIEAADPLQIFQTINKTLFIDKNTVANANITIKKRFSKKLYFDAFEKIIAHIKRGDIYEVNLCQEFYVEGITLDPISTYTKLNSISPTPFSTFFKIGDKFILSASPERFLAKRADTLISQPIKGTAPRGKDKAEDEQIKAALQNNPKEIAENVMIVDLVRNDMTRSAKAGSVIADRKLEVHSFRQVHQLISTISCIQAADISDIRAIKNIFPPGSMTGAPKVNAMLLCEKYEASKRGVYSGTIGYFAPNGDFDFNVVIRTILYNTSNQYLSFHTGGAITIDADPEKEYAECLLKARAILQTLDADSLDDI